MNSITHTSIVSFLYIWRLPIAECMSKMYSIFESCVRRAHWSSASFSGIVFACINIVSHSDLLDAITKQSKVIHILKANKLTIPIHSIEAMLAFNKNMAGSIDSPIAVDTSLASTFPLFDFAPLLLRGMLLHYQRRYQEAIELIEYAYQAVLKMPSMPVNLCCNTKTNRRAMHSTFDSTVLNMITLMSAFTCLHTIDDEL